MIVIEPLIVCCHFYLGLRNPTYTNENFRNDTYTFRKNLHQQLYRNKITYTVGETHYIENLYQYLKKKKLFNKHVWNICWVKQNLPQGLLSF